VISSGRLRRRLDRVAVTVQPRTSALLTGPDDLDALARWAGTSPIEVVAEARRIDTLCRAAGAWTTEARLAVVAADGAIPVDALRAATAELQRARKEDAA